MGEKEKSTPDNQSVCAYPRYNTGDKKKGWSRQTKEEKKDWTRNRKKSTNAFVSIKRCII
jgi:outer membrane receptor for ferric coprogen and ferric-rhodotorulic acid